MMPSEVDMFHLDKLRLSEATSRKLEKVRMATNETGSKLQPGLAPISGG
jgi:hypothetical protein